MTTPTTDQIKIGSIVKDRAGLVGAVTLVTEFDGSVWYDVRFDGGEAVRFPSDLSVVRS